MRRTMHYTWSHMNFGGPAISEDMFQWIPRNFNTITDELADKYLVGNRIIENETIKSSSKFFRVYFDGNAQEGKMGEAGAWSRHGPEKGIFQCGLQQ